MTVELALAHDYATQRGGAERVVLAMSAAFPDAPLYTTLYEPDLTFPEFRDLDVRPGVLNAVPVLRRHHRLALPLLPAAIRAQPVDARVLLTSSTGWAHGYRGAEHTVVYCHAPARWLYQRDRYLGSHQSPTAGGRARDAAATAALAALTPPLRRWDRAAAGRADRYLVNSTVSQRAVAACYGIEATVVPPPPALLPEGPEAAVAGVEPGFVLCVARLLPYKNVDVVIEAVNALPGTRLVVVGDGPDRARLQALAGPRVQVLGRVEDHELRWLYRSCSMLVAASYEDYGLSPLEAGAFGRPSVVLRDGGFLDTVVEGVTGAFFGAPHPELIGPALTAAEQERWDNRVIAHHVDAFSPDRFRERLHEEVAAFR